MDLNSKLDAVVDRLDFSGIVSIRRGREQFYERAAGFADRSKKIPNEPDTRFGIASGTKFFTALAIGKLIEEGSLSPSTLLHDCVELDFPLYSDDITIEHLLTHTSGIPDYYDEEKITDFDNFTVAVPWSELKGPRDYLTVFPREEMKFPPGARFSYSNGGYILLGVVIEEVSGLPYQAFVEEKVFQSAGMEHSGFFAMDRLPGNTAIGYLDEEGGLRTNTQKLPVVGASDGGAFTTSQDIASLWRRFWDNKILSKANVALFSKSHVNANAEGNRKSYGYGLWLRERDGVGREIYLEGCDAGVSFRSSWIQAIDLEITVISNTTRGAWPILRETEKLLQDQA